MSEFASGFSIRMKYMFGKIPKTSKLENKKNLLNKNFEELKAIESSKEFIRYKELGSRINSEEFIAKRKEIESLKFQGTEEHKKYIKFTELDKSKEIKSFYAFLGSEHYKKFLSIQDSDKLNEYKALDKLIKSDVFLQYKKDYNFTNTEEHKKEIKFQELSGDQDIKSYLKIIKSSLYINYKNLQDSNKLAKYESLRSKVESSDFQSKLKEYKKEKSSEYAEFTEYNSLKNDKEIKNFFIFTNKSSFKTFEKINGSQKLEEFEKLKEYIGSDRFKDFKKNYKYTNTDNYKKEKRLKELEKDPDIKFYHKLLKNKNYLNFKALNGGEKIKKHEELKDFVNSEEFIAFKSFREDKDRFKKTEEFKLQEEFNTLKRSDKIKQHQNLSSNNDYTEQRNYSLSFEEDFNNGKLDNSKWLTRFSQGKDFFNNGYANINDLHLFTGSENFNISNSILKISLKKQKTKGKVWNPMHGFLEKNFDYTSGLISTSESFKQKYGIFEAKVKLSKGYPVRQACWLVAGRMLPHINFFNQCEGNISKWEAGSFWSDQPNGSDIKKTGHIVEGINLSSDFHIFRIEWSKDRLVWKINDFTVFETTKGIPHEPMYLNFSLSLEKEINDSKLPINMEIDWVKCYKENNTEEKTVAK